MTLPNSSISDPPRRLIALHKSHLYEKIATDPEAIRELKPCLVEAGYQYEEREAFWENILGNTAPKLRLPIKVSQI